MSSILQDWVQELGLRHQGVLLTAVRGPDGTSKENAAKALTRCYRAAILVAHCGDPLKSKSFIEKVKDAELMARLSAVQKDHDALPHHWLLHLIHATEILGYKMPDEIERSLWRAFYLAMCRKFHMAPESAPDMDARLNADEMMFASNQ